jgi:hypothetical protein
MGESDFALLHTAVLRGAAQGRFLAHFDNAAVCVYSFPVASGQSLTEELSSIYAARIQPGGLSRFRAGYPQPAKPQDWPTLRVRARVCHPRRKGRVF